jgi:prephenate dehydrogenase
VRRVAIVGLGLIGGSLGLALRKYQPDIFVVGVARRDETAARAEARGAASLATTDLTAIAGAEVVVIAASLQNTAELIEECAPLLGAGALLTDVGSVKSSVMEVALRTLPARRFLGGHPFAGKAVGGIDNADADLFLGRPWVFTPEDGQPPAAGPAAEWVDVVRALGAAPVLFMPPDAHDRLAALISHVPFLLSAAYLVAAGRAPDWAAAKHLASSGFADFTRIGGGDAEMYSAVVRANREAILEGVTRLREVLDELEAAAGSSDADIATARLVELFTAARGVRGEWEALQAQLPEARK